MTSLSLSQMTTLLRGLDSEPETTLRTEQAPLRRLLSTDLYALIWFGLGRKDIEHPWLFDRCREVEAAPDGFLDLWAREHYKSTIITLAKTIQDILANPEITVGIFSHTRPIAKGFLRQIKRELEFNQRLKILFPDVLWDNPEKEAPTWSEDSGIVVKRKSNPKESTVEAWGLVDGQPTAKHFQLMVYDDLVTQESVTSPEMMEKVTRSFELSLNLGTITGKKRMIGTYYHFNDTYHIIQERGTFTPRIYPGSADGTDTGKPVFWSQEVFNNKRRDMGPHTFGCQILLDPVADKTQGFREDWLRFYTRENGQGMNKYIVVDPASAKKKSSDYTAMLVIGLAPDQNYYVLDMIRDRLQLTERADALFALHRRWRPLGVGYERYGMMADLEHIKFCMEQWNYRFGITELGGPMPKPDRIKRLVPIFEQGRLWLPEECKKRDYEGVLRELVGEFIDQEYRAFPVGLHDDMLDCMARITDEDLHASWPIVEEPHERYAASRAPKRNPNVGWMSV